MKVAIYARRSTEEHQEASLEVQTGEAKRYIEAKGWTLADDAVFIDDAVSRAEFKRRPGLIALLNAAGAKAFDAVVVRDETRIGGDTYRSGIVIQDLLDSGARLFYYYSDEEVTLDKAVDKFLVAARNFASELEREKIAQRTREHLMVKARRGLNAGGRVYGYDNIPVEEGGRRVRVEYRVNPDQAEIVREVWQRYYLDGHGIRMIAKDLNARRIAPPTVGRRGTASWSPSVIWFIARNERYLGRLRWGRFRKGYRGGTKVREIRPEAEWIRADAPHLRIIDAELQAAAEQRWRSVEDARARASSGRAGAAGPRPRYLLSGLARCAECGGPMQAINHRIGGETVKVYVCAYHRNRGDAVCRNTLRRPVAEVDAAVLDEVSRTALREELIVETIGELRRRLADRGRKAANESPEMEREIRTLTVEIDRLTEGLASGSEKPGAVVRAISEREKRVTALQARLAAIRTAPSVIDLEARRLEQEARRRLVEFRAVFGRRPSEARTALEALLDGPLRLTPVDVDGEKRYQVDGLVAVGGLITTVCVPNGIRTRATGLKGRSPNH